MDSSKYNADVSLDDSFGDCYVPVRNQFSCLSIYTVEVQMYNDCTVSKLGCKS